MSKPLHCKARLFEQKGLFAGLRSFVELEARVAALPDEQTKGSAFEVFGEAYLATQRRHELARVWPILDIPIHVLKNLALPLRDYGIDMVAETVLGKFAVYQVKFRSDRERLTWRELSTFIGLADSAHIQSRVVFTNCNDLPAVMNERKGFFCIRGSDLDRLGELDFQAIESWLRKASVPSARKQPHLHQQEALDALLPALREGDRVTAIMACGTGKTLVALWAAEQMMAQRILILLPSLALLRQTLHEWLHETRLLSLAHLCVCSDPTVTQDLDAIVTPQSDLDFPVSTDFRSVREFLDAPFSGAKVIFSTYQSARVVGGALRKGEIFDVGIFDEAHRTDGAAGRNYAFALEDSNLPIRKRLYLTATPRHYNTQCKSKEGNAQLVFSMDKPHLYGRAAFSLTFAEAARRGIICQYKVIISVITSEMVTNELLRRGEVLVKGDLIRARQVANQIAIKDALARYSVNKVFTFHRTVKSAQSFVSDGPEGITTHLRTSAATDAFRTLHVNGTMPTALREALMRDFRASARGLISNARCLTEGVDVPAVDMVAFLSPRRSRVDIVQAIGRAMRRAPGKTTGYVLLPLYVEQASGETVPEAVERGNFDEVWDVLQSLQEQDEVLAGIIRGMREERGRTKGFDDSRFRERVEILGPEMSLEELRRSISTTCITRLADDWEERFGELKAFKDRFGHCKVLDGWSENPRLAAWVHKQRTLRKAMRADRFRRLDEIGFLWDAKAAAWENRFADLVEYKKSHGNCDVPVRWKNNLRLGRWVHAQRIAYKERRLCSDRIKRLEAIGFRWDPYADWWEEWFAKLEDFKKINGHCEPSRNDPKSAELAFWINGQRMDRQQGRLSRECVRRLTELGMSWDPRTDLWEQRLSELVKFREVHGHCLVPSRSQEYRKLSSWVGTQREFRKRGKLTEDRTKRLNEWGFVWNSKDAVWEAMFKELVEFWKVHRHCNVPYDWPQNPKLGNWVSNQRLFRKKGKLSRLTAERIGRMDALGFPWEISKA